MRIAMANNYYYLKGGAERVLFEEKKILEAHGHKVPVFSQSHPYNEVSEYSDYYPPFKDWSNISRLQKISMAFNMMYDRQTARVFNRFLEAADSDIIHAHNIYGGLTTSVLDIAQRKGIPVVMTLHDYKLICPSYLMLNRGTVCEGCKNGRFIRCLLKACHKESLTASGVYCIESYLNKWLHKYDTIRYFICPSKFSLTKHAENGIALNRLLHIRNFVNFATHTPQYENCRYALFVGRLSKEKGILTLLKAIEHLDVPVRIVGDGPLKAQYEGLVAEHKMNHVTFEGYKSGEDLKQLYKNATFLVIPSEWYENAPMTILEAYVYGKPVIGSRIGGIPEMIEHDRTGLLFEPGNVDELAGCIHTLFSSKHLAAEMGRAARNKAEREFSAEAHYKQLMEVYTSICQVGGSCLTKNITMNRREFIKIGSSTLLGSVMHCRTKSAVGEHRTGNVIIELEITDEVLTNPGMGFETFNSFNGDERNILAENYPECSIAYFRFYWSKLEPREGTYNFDLIDSLLEKGLQNGQDLALRFMPTSAADSYEGTPKWFMEKANGYWYKKNDRTGWAPEHNDPYFLAKQEELVSAFGERYNGNQNIIRMDIGSVGFWGEWHMSHTEPAIPMISEENAVKIIDMYLKYWDEIPLSMLIGYVPGLRYAVSKGTGWRADSMGDYGHFSDTWCHMFDAYPQNLEQAEALEAWKNGPVAFEPPGTMHDLDEYVPEIGGGYNKMWDKALQWHGSDFNAKSKSIYSHQVPSIQYFLKRCGYRLTLRRIVLPKILSPGQRHFPLDMEIENTGVAPVYKNYIPAIKLSGSRVSVIMTSKAKVCEWLPGSHRVQEDLLLPETLGAGNYLVSFGILNPGNHLPAIRLANKGTDTEGWCPFCILEKQS
ncbi:MAG: glycosyltransferase [Planctomycetota bacterium]|jgi:glycosyltransferase involved in cell wall biosynthesis